MTSTTKQTEGTTNPTTGLLNRKQAAQWLGISERKLWELTNRREIASVRIGNRVLYDPADLQTFVASAKEGGRE